MAIANYVAVLYNFNMYAGVAAQYNNKLANYNYPTALCKQKLCNNCDYSCPTISLQSYYSKTTMHYNVYVTFFEAYCICTYVATYLHTNTFSIILIPLSYCIIMQSLFQLYKCFNIGK